MDLKSKRSEVIYDMLVNFLQGSSGECRLSDTEILHTKKNGNMLSLIYTTDSDENINLMKIDKLDNSLLINTERDVMQDLVDYRKAVKKIPYKYFDVFTYLDVSKHDFFGNHFVISSPNYAINKFNRHFV